MGLRYFYIDANGETAEATDRVRIGSSELVTSAEEGYSGSSTIELDDPEGTLDAGGLRKWWVTQDLVDAEADDTAGVVWVGYSAERKAQRDVERTGQAAHWDGSVTDLNAVLEDRILLGDDCDRPAETDVERLAWVLSRPEVSFTGGPLVTTEDPVDMDPADYRKQHVRDVINDCAQESGRNWFLRSVASGDEEDPTAFELAYQFDASEAWPSDVRISNVLADHDPDNLTFAASRDAEIEVTPSRVYSGVVVDYDGGWVYVERESTIENFRRRDTTMMAPNVKSAATARARGRRYLRDLATEEHVITVAIQVPPEHLNRLRAGQRAQVKFTHLGPWYREWTWLRVVSRTVRELTPEVYEIAVELTTDNPADVAFCPNPTPAGDFWPLGGSGNTPNPSASGNVLYLRPGIAFPRAVTPGHVGVWHFPQYSAGGEGLTDYAGDCVQNHLRFVVVGDGTMSIQTQQHMGAHRPLTARLFHLVGNTSVVDAMYQESAGDEFVIPISTHGGTICTHWVDIKDNHSACGGKWGWSRMTWEPTE
jgi:hypothetical protein